jgi:predicted aspartyl protease
MRGVATWAWLFTTILGVCVGASDPETVPHLPGAPPGYRIKLDPYVAPPAITVGLLVKVRINGGPMLRLLLDSGTQYIVLNRRAALKSGCAGGSDIELVGAGAPSATRVKQLHADTLQVGELTLRGVPLLITELSIADGIQGALPMSIFAGFLIRLDISGKALDLSPYPAEPVDLAGAIRAFSNHQLLFVKGTVNETREGYFLLDTGASYTAISRNLARQLNFSDLLAPRVALQGGTADMDAPLLNGSVRLRFGSRQLATGPVVAVDLSTTSRYHGLEISGLIGYAALRDSVLTVSYREGLIRISPK